jgi:putative glycerol-1-phosphate prenyltransferase
MLKSEIYERVLNGEKLWAILIDPDKLPFKDITDFILMTNKSSCDFILVGGSLINHLEFDTYLKKIYDLSSKKIILFPGDNQQISNNADGFLLLSLISGRNPDLLIGQHVKSSFKLKKSGLEIISCGYMLIETENLTSAIYISESLPIPKDKSDIAAATALAGEQLGLNFIYMDTGSGAESTVKHEMITSVQKNISIPLFIGGGINNQEQLESTWEAGADIAVVGTCIENDFNKMFGFKKLSKSK